VTVSNAGTIQAGGIALHGGGGSGAGSIDLTGAGGSLTVTDSETLDGATIEIGNAATADAITIDFPATLTLGSNLLVQETGTGALGAIGGFGSIRERRHYPRGGRGRRADDRSERRVHEPGHDGDRREGGCWRSISTAAMRGRSAT
jgi:hypothetical protein